MRLMMLHAFPHFLSPALFPTRVSRPGLCVCRRDRKGSVTRVTCCVKRKELRYWHFMSRREREGITREMMSKQRKTAIEQKPSLKRYPPEIVSYSQSLCPSPPRCSFSSFLAFFRLHTASRSPYCKLLIKRQSRFLSLCW